MTPVETMLLASRYGVALSRRGDKLRVESNDPPPTDLVAAVRENKAALLAMLQNIVEFPPTGDLKLQQQHTGRLDQTQHMLDAPSAPHSPNVRPEARATLSEALADTWIAISLERISTCYADIAEGCLLDTPAWAEAEDRVNGARGALDRQALREALDAYERFARAEFERASRCGRQA